MGSGEVSKLGEQWKIFVDKASCPVHQLWDPGKIGCLSLQSRSQPWTGVNTPQSRPLWGTLLEPTATDPRGYRSPLVGATEPFSSTSACAAGFIVTDLVTFWACSHLWDSKNGESDPHIHGSMIYSRSQ